MWVKDSIITIDAMRTQREIAKKIIENKANYILAVKGNQGKFGRGSSYTLPTCKFSV
ncbi:MAG: hypothetical protein LBF04_02385 [Prevotellaceae bacterium]|jgi:predicted transposase YbfD/YdcC|nr:hypothetical protein [Prevotellaceae bacterium]